MRRDDFTQSLKDTLAKRVAYRCSNPDCRVITAGPHSEPGKHVNLGVASHITAAAVGGPRYDPNLSPDDRRAHGNAIWLCQTCAKHVDSDTCAYSSELLFVWKSAAEKTATRELAGIPETEFFPLPSSALHAPIPRIDDHTYDAARDLLIHAGWQPQRQHWTHASNFDMQYGNGLHFWNKGYHEIRHASGTGLAMCTFGFTDVYRNTLVVVTAGEVFEEVNATAFVWRWYFEGGNV